MLNAVIGAVSVRNIRGPSRTGLNPASVAAAISSSVSPPSGPINRATGWSGHSSAPISYWPAGSSNSFDASAGTYCANASEGLHGGSMAGILARPHCSQALIAIFLQCSIFLVVRAASIRATSSSRLPTVASKSVRLPPLRPFRNPVHQFWLLEHFCSAG